MAEAWGGGGWLGRHTFLLLSRHGLWLVSRRTFYLYQDSSNARMAVSFADSLSLGLGLAALPASASGLVACPARRLELLEASFSDLRWRFVSICRSGLGTRGSRTCSSSASSILVSVLYRGSRGL